MHGFPGENAETTQETISFLTELKDALTRVVLYRFSPVPGSPIYGAPEVLHHDWADYSIYENNQKWWGSGRDFQIVNDSYQRLRDQIIHLFGRVN
jgi:anaerobic magnesium-protoporphyrin IX monomethyl ester cyclase